MRFRHVKITRTKIPKLLDSVQARMWMDYSVNYSKKNEINHKNFKFFLRRHTQRVTARFQEQMFVDLRLKPY